MPTVPPQASEPDMVYWKNTFIELGFGEDQSHYSTPNYPPNNGHPHYEQQVYHQSHAPIPPQEIQYQANIGQVPQYIR